jgi:DNA-binding transcriptional regulator GbsR (MarR family)
MTETSSPRGSRLDLSPLAWHFITHWGEMGSRWGVNRTVAQIHALLFLVGRPLHAEEIADTLDVARSNVSNSLRELQDWSLVRLVHLLGDRRDHFETARDVWDLFRTIVSERKEREFEPTVIALRECVNDRNFSGEERGAQLRIKETLALMEALSAWSDEMLRLDKATLSRILKLGSKIQRMLRESR